MGHSYYPASVVWTDGDGMSGLRKLGVVLAGYAAAWLVAFAACYAAEKLNRSPDASGGMQAFGDMIRFLGLFGLLAIVPTALALYYLRPVPKFWTALSIAAVALAATGMAAAAMMSLRFPRFSWGGAIVNYFSLMTVMGAPLFGLGFLACTIFAPSRRPRLVLLSAAIMEFSVCAYALFCVIFMRTWIP